MDESVYRKYHSISSNEYPLFQNYQLVGDSQLVRFAELFLNSKRQYHQNSSGRVGYCIGGQTAQQLARNLEQKAWPVCRNVILLIGTNDINHNTDPSEWKATLVKIIAMFQQYRVDNVLLLTVPPVPKTWHTVEHWMLFVEYNETLKELETKYKDSFRSLQLLDISSIFFTKSTHSANCRDLYVVSPVREGMEHYDEEFMMSCSNSKKWSRGSKDNSYLRENISLFDTINMNYKLTNCVQGQTNDEDASINKDRFDLIGVTLTDVRNIKSKLLAINNEEYLYILRHAFQKFLAHLKREMKEEKFESLYVSAYRDLSDDLVVQRKLPRSESYDAPGEDLETSGVLCRSLDASDTSGAYATPRVATTRHTTVATSAVTTSTHSTAFSATSTFVAAPSAVSTSTPLPTIPPFTIKSEISLRRSLLTDTSPVSSRVKRRGSKDNVWFELSKQADDKTTSSGSTDEGRDRTHDPLDASRGDMAETVDKLSTKGMHRRAVNSAMIPRQVVLKQNLGTSTRVHPSTSSDDISSGVPSTSNRSPGNSHNPSRQPGSNRTHSNRYPDPDGENSTGNPDPDGKNSTGNPNPDGKNSPRNPGPGSRKPPDPSTGKKHRERSFRDVLGFIQKTLIEIKMENDPIATGNKHEHSEKTSRGRGIEAGPSNLKDPRQPLRVRNAQNLRFDDMEKSLETSHFKIDDSNMKDAIEVEATEKICEKPNNQPLAGELREPSSSRENDDNNSDVVNIIWNDLSKSSTTPTTDVRDSRPYFLKSIEKDFFAKQSTKTSGTQFNKSIGMDVVATPWEGDIEPLRTTLNDSNTFHRTLLNDNYTTYGSLQNHSDTTSGTLNDESTYPGSLLNDSIHAILHDYVAPTPAVPNNVRHVSLGSGHEVSNLQNNPNVTYVKNNLSTESGASLPNNLRPVNNANFSCVLNDISRHEHPDYSANNDQSNLNISYSKNDMRSYRDKNSNYLFYDPLSPIQDSWSLSHLENVVYPPRDIDSNYSPENLRSSINERRSSVELVPMHSLGSSWEVNETNVSANTSNRRVSLQFPEQNPRLREVPNNLCRIQNPIPSFSYISNDLCQGDYQKTNTNSRKNNAETAELVSPNLVDSRFFPNEEILPNVNCYASNLNIDIRRPHINVADSNCRGIDSCGNISAGTIDRRMSSVDSDLYPGEVQSNRFVTENEGSLIVRCVVNNPPDAVVIDIESDTEGPSHCSNSLPSPEISSVANIYPRPFLPGVYNPAMLPARDHSNKSSLNSEMEIINKINSTLENPLPHHFELSEDVHTQNQPHTNVQINNSPESYYGRCDLTYHNTYVEARNLESNFNINNNNDSFTYQSSEYLHASNSYINYSESIFHTSGEKDFYTNLTNDNPVSHFYSNLTSESAYESAHSSLTNNLTPSYLPDMEIPTGFKYLNSPVESERKDASVSKKRSYEANVGRDTQHVTSEEIGAPPERKMKNRGESVTRSAHSSASNFSDSKKYAVDMKDSKKYVDMNDNKVPSNVEEADVLTIDYLTQEEKRDLEARLKKRAVKRDLSEKYGKRPGRQDGSDRNFLQRLSAIQFYQFVQAVTRYESSHDMTPLMEKTFYLHLRNMRSTEGGDLESKFHHSMLGRYEFYKFMKYISLDYIVPKMFSNKFKKVMFTSQVDASSKQEKYAAKSLDISVFETHFSRLAHAPRNKPPRVDLVHFNQKGFELLRDYLSQAIGQMEQRDSDA